MPLFWLSLAFLLGIWLGKITGWSLASWIILTALSGAGWLIGLFLARKLPDDVVYRLRLPNPANFPHSTLPLALVILFISLGGLRFQLAQPKVDSNFIAYYNDSGVSAVIDGVLVEPPDVRDRYILLKIRAEQIQPAGSSTWVPVDGLLLASLSAGGDWSYGDRLRLEGLLESPPRGESFSYRDYLAQRGVYAYMPFGRASKVAAHQGSRVMASIYSFKGKALEVIYRIFPDPEASLLAGILLGVDTGIPGPVVKAFQDTGTAHIIAISGFNMAIVAGLFTLLFSRLLGKRKGAVAAIIGIVVYTILVGAGASVVRAALMAGLGVFAGQIGRRQAGLNTLAIVAAVMVCLNPLILWDVSFQLSFMATLGLVLYSGQLIDGFYNLVRRFFTEETSHKLADFAGPNLVFTLAAILTTLPITVYYFERLSLVSPFANLLVLPAQPPVMVLGGLAVLLGMIWQPLGQFAAYLAWPFVVYTIRMVEFWAGLQGGAVVLGRVSVWVVLGFYLALFGLTAGRALWRKPAPAAPAEGAPAPEPGRFEKMKAWLVAGFVAWRPAIWSGLAVITVLTWRAAWYAPDGRMHLSVLDVGSGEAILIQTPGGRYVLVNGGASPSALSDALGRRMPLGHRRLDYLVVAGTEDEQLGALPRSLERFPPAQALWAGPEAGSRSARQLEKALVEMKIPIVSAQTGQAIDLGEGAWLKVISANSRGAVLLLEMGSFRALLPVGVDFETLEALGKDSSLAGVSALLLSDGGYAPANPPDLIDHLNPQVALLSVAAGDRRGLPDEETLQAVQGYPLLRTDLDGWIELSTDGEQMWADVERK